MQLLVSIPEAIKMRLQLLLLGNHQFVSPFDLWFKRLRSWTAIDFTHRNKMLRAQRPQQQINFGHGKVRVLLSENLRNMSRHLGSIVSALQILYCL